MFFLKKNWQVLSQKKKKKNGRLFGIIVEFEKTKDCWKEMIKAKKRPLESKSLLDKKQCCMAQENVTVGIMLSLAKKKKKKKRLESRGKCDSWNQSIS